MAFVPAGEFVMGSDWTDESSLQDEYPEHVVSLSAYWIDLYEVTNAEFAAFLNDYGGNVSPDGYEMLDDDDADRRIFLDDETWYAEPEHADHPVIEVSWYGAATFCDSHGKRLPTEAEWEKAARGGCEIGGDPLACEDPDDERTYPWGDVLDCEHANYGDCEDDTTPVGSYPLGVSPYGVYDMAGNVWEWCSDWYQSAYYAASPEEDPQGPESGNKRVTRGGACCGYGLDPRCAYRFFAPPAYTGGGLGFRCARSYAAH